MGYEEAAEWVGMAWAVAPGAGASACVLRWLAALLLHTVLAATA